MATAFQEMKQPHDSTLLIINSQSSQLRTSDGHRLDWYKSPNINILLFTCKGFLRDAYWGEQKEIWHHRNTAFILVFFSFDDTSDTLRCEDNRGAKWGSPYWDREAHVCHVRRASGRTKKTPRMTRKVPQASCARCPLSTKLQLTDKCTVVPIG